MTTLPILCVCEKTLLGKSKPVLEETCLINYTASTDFIIMKLMNSLHDYLFTLNYSYQV